NSNGSTVSPMLARRDPSLRCPNDTKISSEPPSLAVARLLHLVVIRRLLFARRSARVTLADHDSTAEPVTRLTISDGVPKDPASALRTTHSQAEIDEAKPGNAQADQEG